MKELNTLKRLGLTEYESLVFLVLIRQGSSDVRSISSSCAVPKNKIYESLQNLLKKGLIEFLPTTPKKYILKDVNVLDGLLESKETDLAELRKEISSLKKFSQSRQVSNSEEIVSIDYGHKSFLAKIKVAISKTHGENLILARKIRSDPVVLRLTKEAIRRGTKVYLIVPDESSSLQEWKKIGVNVRSCKDFPKITFSTFDSFLCRVNLDLENPRDPTLWIESSFFIEVLRDYFFNLWKKC